MNINDCSGDSTQLAKDTHTEDRLQLIFIRQAELMEKYHVIEEKNGLLLYPFVPANLDDAKAQARLKDFAWRVTEEVAETLDSYYKKEPIEHMVEEMADVCHFMVEMAIISGISPTDLIPSDTLPSPGRDLLDHLWSAVAEKIGPYPQVILPEWYFCQFIRNLGMTCHTLKNKAWKQTQMITDKDEYRKRFVTAMHSFVALCIAMGMTSKDMFNYYFRKSEVNSFRQRSKY